MVYLLCSSGKKHTSDDVFCSCIGIKDVVRCEAGASPEINIKIYGLSHY